MFNKIISWSLGNKITVLVFSGIMTIAGIWSVATMKVDILPDINKPTVTVFAESPGMAAEEVERLVLNPLESAIAGAPGIERLTGNASYSQATVNIEFAWGSDRLRNRQIVQERLAQVIMPQGVKPILGPSTSLLGEIMWIGVSSANQKTSPMELRTLADWIIRPALLRTAGVANVLVMGGDVREWQINVNAERLRRYDIMFDDVRTKVESMLTNRSGGVITEDEKEYAIRILTAPTVVADLEEVAIRRSAMDGRPIRLGDIAEVIEGPSPIRGSGAIDGEPDDVLLHPDLFRQESFIRAGLSNVEDALRDGTILVIIILIIFLMNLRMTAITISAIPLSILATAIVFRYFDLSVNVMTLGGIAVAVGELVDDAIVDVENIFHRLRDWMKGDRSVKREEIVLSASKEVRNSIVYATVLVAVVFLPIFFMPGIEGKLIIALGTAYLVSLFASMAVSLTVTPVLSALLLNDKSLVGHEQETKIVQKIKARITPWIAWCITNVKVIGSVTLVALLVTVGLYYFAGKEGIPPFNEGSMVAMVYLPPGTALSTTNEYMTRLEAAVLQVKGVRQVSNIAGRAPADPHGGSANSSEMQIAITQGFESEHKRIFKDIQAILDKPSTGPAMTGGIDFSLGQPITHRVEMLISGVRAPIVVKVFGDDPATMEIAAKRVVTELSKQKGIANARIGQNTIVPELRLYVDRNRLAEYGLSSGEVARGPEMGLVGGNPWQIRLGPASGNVG